jgi:hypothetical protein
MVIVKEHGNTFETRDPSTGEWTQMTNVVFIEKGRDGVNKTLSDSSQALNEAAGLTETTGLDNTRTHTQPVRTSLVAEFPVGKEFALHINREMWSIPQMANQEGKVPRIIGNKLTFFKTSLSKNPEEDKDYRTVEVSSDDMVSPDLVNQAKRSLRATEVRVISRPAGASSGISDQDMNAMRQQA